MATKESQSAHWRGKSKEIVISYFESPPAIKRSKFYVDQLRQYNFESIFEVGYFAARNLYYIQQAFSSVKLAGLEINPKAVKFAKEKLGQDSDLLCMDLYDMDDIKETYDIVFSSGVLIHVPTDNIKDVLEKMIRRANKYVMHIEQNGNNELAAGPKHLKPKYKSSDQWQWNNDIIGTYKDLGYDPKVIPLPDDCKTNGASELLIVEL